MCGTHTRPVYFEDDIYFFVIFLICKLFLSKTCKMFKKVMCNVVVFLCFYMFLYIYLFIFKYLYILLYNTSTL